MGHVLEKRCLEKVILELISREVRIRAEVPSRGNSMNKATEDKSCVVCAGRQLGVPGV